MSEFRQNFLTREWVIMAPERAKRPDQFNAGKTKKELPEFDAKCPFCPGNEKQTPPSVDEIKGGASWSQRVIPNKFAAVSPSASTERKKDNDYFTAGGFGVAEVLIETPLHNQTPATSPLSDVRNVLKLYKARYTKLSENKKIDLITIFKNHGAGAGTSLEHPHSQIIATGIIPPHVRYPMQQALSYYDNYGKCPFCNMLEEELEAGKRLVFEGDHFVALCPFASVSPFAMRIIPRRHNSKFDCITDKEMDELAMVLKTMLKKLYVGLNNPDYNYVIRSSPNSDGELNYDHWQLLIVPRLTQPAGFEIGTGIFINTMIPEEAAKFLRSVNAD